MSSTLFPYTSLFRSCCDLIKASDLCLLPVKNNRASPGSPLKLYDYISNGRFVLDRKSTRLNSSHVKISYAVFCLKKKKILLSAFSKTYITFYLIEYL